MEICDTHSDSHTDNVTVSERAPSLRTDHCAAVESTVDGQYKKHMNSEHLQPKERVQSERLSSCRFFVKKKRRFCKFRPVEGYEYCVEHLPQDHIVQLNSGVRVPCPLDPHHTVYESKLQAHLRKCNAKAVNLGEFQVRDVNRGTTTEPPAVALGDIDISVLKALVERVKVVYAKHVGEIKESIKSHQLLEDDINNPSHQKCLKHRRQEGSIIGHMDDAGWFKDGTAYIEFGAGRARLTQYIITAVQDQTSSQFILIDRDHARNKCENKFRDQTGPGIERLRIDIKDLALDKHSCLRDRSMPVIAYSKHLCGCATDLTLRCLERLESSSSMPSDVKRRRNGSRVRGILVALCCHHRCTWRDFVGQKFWVQQGFTADEFVIVRALTGWATCAFPQKARVEKCDVMISADSAEDHKPDPANNNELTHSRYDCWTVEERESIGRQCKRLIDTARLNFLTSLGFDAQLLAYVRSDVSLENVMLYACCKDNALTVEERTTNLV